MAGEELISLLVMIEGTVIGVLGTDAAYIYYLQRFFP